MTSGVTSPGEQYSPLDEDALQDLYTWIDEIPLSRPKRSIARDFSDGVLVAEIVHHYQPKMVELHNYTPANAQSQKLTNWSTLNRKVLSKLNYTVPDNTVKAITLCKQGCIEQVLHVLRIKIDKFLAKKKAQLLRDKDQMYDEFSPNGPIADHNTYIYNEGYSTNGPENNYGYAFNTGPVDMNRYSGYPHPQAELTGHPGAPPSIPLSGHRQSEILNTDEPMKGSNVKLKHRGSNPEKGSRPSVPPNKGGKVPRAQSYHDVSNNGDTTTLRLHLEEKEQSLLASQETIQILQVKIRRLEHLLHLKDIRIDDLTKRLQQATHPPPRQLPPQQNPPQPIHGGEQGMHPAMMNMHHQQPLPPLQHHPQQHLQYQDGHQ